MINMTLYGATEEFSASFLPVSRRNLTVYVQIWLYLAMISVKIAELRNQLSRYLKKVRRGAEVVITDRDTPIGRLIPYENDERGEPFELIPPPKGYAGLSKMRFEPTQYPLDIVELLVEDRRRR